MKREAEMTQGAIGPSRSADPFKLGGTAHAVYVSQQNRRMWSEMAELVKAHPELQKELTELQEANRALDGELQKGKEATPD